MRAFELSIWLALGAFSAVATIGGSLVCAGLTLYCGYMAGRSLDRPNW